MVTDRTKSGYTVPHQAWRACNLKMSDAKKSTLQDQMCNSTHLHGLADASALDDEVVEASGPGKPPHLLNEVLPQCAADASVLHSHALSVIASKHDLIQAGFDMDEA